MSLLGKQVYANPTTPIWGQGGGVSGSSLTLTGTPNQTLSNTFYGGATTTITAVDASGNLAPLSAGEMRAYDGVGSYVSLGQTGLGAGLRAFYDDGSLQNTFAAFTGGGWDLSNVSSINGVPYFNSPGTYFDFSNQGGTGIAEAPDFTTLNAFSFTAPVNGKLYMESLGNYVSTAKGGGGNMTFAINGTNLTNAINQFNAYDSNVNLFGMSMYQIPVSGGSTYDISSIAQCSALPPAGADLLVQTSRLFLLFTPQ